MGNAMAHGVELVQAGERLALAHQLLEDQGQGVPAAGQLGGDGLAVVLEAAVVRADGVDHALGKHLHVLGVCRVEELVLERAGARVEDQDPH